MYREGSKAKLVKERGTEVEEEIGEKDDDCSKNYGRRRMAKGKTARRGNFAGEEGQEKGQSRRLLFSPIDDADLRHLPFETLDAQRLLYVLGRASILVEAEVQDTKSGDSMEQVSCFLSSPGDLKRAEDSDDDLCSHTDTVPRCELPERAGLPAPECSGSPSASSTLPGGGGEEEQDKADETTSSSPFTSVSPRGRSPETSRCSLLADDLYFWISIYSRLGILLPSLSPREFSRAVQGLGYVRPRLLQLAEKTLHCIASETGTESSRSGDTATSRETNNHGRKTAAGSLTREVCSDEDHVFHPAIRNRGKTKSRSPSVMSSTSDSHLLREEIGIHRRKEEKGGVSWVSVEQARKFLETDANLVVQLRRQVGLQATQFHGDCLSRVFYGMVRGQMEGDPQFLDFFTSEGKEMKRHVCALSCWLSSTPFSYNVAYLCISGSL